MSRRRPRISKEERDLIITLSLSGGFGAGTIAKAVLGKDTETNRQTVYNVCSYWDALLRYYRRAQTPAAQAYLRALLIKEKKWCKKRKTA